jgi:hypothetical protein
MIPLTGMLLAVAMVGLGLRAKTNGYGPFVLSFLSAATILFGKFQLESNAVAYAGIALLVIASAWSLAGSGDRSSHRGNL